MRWMNIRFSAGRILWVDVDARHDERGSDSELFGRVEIEQKDWRDAADQNWDRRRETLKNQANFE